ncbi:hypothetical protein SAMN04488056_101423 [Cohaesibacter marisflavi]|uniref:Uncharacterized protein n=1 Tax=Cohaesibacter marisflavi TaxID=655353 RepID=A0A1I5ABJ7_9HYPH|nr:hypothetical protein [Cohaesibacter marisflavi]SFN59783.1 hypothetical protein SAMN04488056_101423 [Cohaesibacter marisflavi]
MLTLNTSIAPLIFAGLIGYFGLKSIRDKAKHQTQKHTDTTVKPLRLTRSAEDAIMASKRARGPQDLEQKLLLAYREAKTFKDPTFARMIEAELREIRSSKRSNKATPPKN